MTQRSSLKTNKRGLLLSAGAIIFSLVFMIGALFAWFEMPNKSNDFLMYVGDIDLACEVYVFKDDLEDGQTVDFGSETRSQIIDNYYLSMSKAKENNKTKNLDGSETFSNLYFGKQMRYKIVIYNKSATKSDAGIDVSFANMTGYFKKCIDLVIRSGLNKDSELKELFSENSSRLLFNIREVKTAAYTNASGSAGFNTLVEGSSYDFTNGQHWPLWKYSRGEAFKEYLIEGAVLSYGNLLEIDFVLSCDFYTEEIVNYNNKANDLYKYFFASEDQELDGTISSAIEEVASKESLYVFGEDSSKLEFAVKGITIRGRQLPEGN